MSFRNIRPSTQGLSNSTSESTSSDAAKKIQGESSSSSASKRRRVPDSVTRNACVNCKKARAKCDGKKPCGRCATRVEPSTCIYEVHIKHAKEELVRQIKDLEAKDNTTQQILRALSTDQHVAEILQRLKNGESYDAIAEWLAPLDALEELSPTGSQHSTLDLSDQEMGGSSSTSQWTTVTLDPSILDHLFQLYFSWVHPVHTLFSEGHFVESFRNKSQVYCSSVLVNAMCALACHLLSHTESDEIEQLGQSFSDAVRSEISPHDRRLTTMQAFGVMFLVDCARGKSLRATSYLRFASSNLSNVDILDEYGFPDVLSSTIQGIRCLNIEWSQMTFQMPPSFTQISLETSKEKDEELDNAKWYFYRYVNDQCPAWSGLMASTNREKIKLIDIINDVTTMFYNTSGPPIQADHILQHYTRYLHWREGLPSSIGDIENNNSQALPHVLSLLILYSNSVVQLLRPLLELDNLNPAGLDEVIWKHAQTGLFLLDQHYRTQYTCRYQLVLQMFAVLHLCDVIARFFPGKVDSSTKDGPEAIQFGLEALTQSFDGFPIAGTLQELLKHTAIECSVPLPSNLADLMMPQRSLRLKYRIDDFIDACTRPSYLPPNAEIQARFESNFSADWHAQSPSQGFREPDPGSRSLRRSDAEQRAAQNLMQISNLLNRS